MKLENIIFSICARKNSKGLINKNIKSFNSRPLINWTIDKVLKVKKNHKFTISTDSDEIIKIAKKRNIDIFFKRNSKLASSKTPKIDVWRDLLIKAEKHYNQKFDYLIDFDCSNPLIKSKDIKKMIYDSFIKIKKNCDLMLMINESNKNPYFNMLEKKGKKLKIIKTSKKKISRRQDAPECYNLANVCYVFKPKFILKTKNVLLGKVGFIEIPKERAIDIDDEIDYKLVSTLSKKNT